MRDLIFIYTVISVVALTSCINISSETKKEEPLIIDYTSNIITAAENRLDTSAHQIRIAYYKDYVLYEIPSINYETFETSSVNGQIINKVAPRDTILTDYILKKNSEFGYISSDKKDPAKFSVDSLLKSISLHPNMLEFFGVELVKPDKIVQSNRGMIEKYFTKRLTSDPDSIYRYYDKSLNRIPFSFSPLLDKSKKAKLWRTDLIYLPKTKDGERKTASFQIELIKTKDKERFRKLFIEFENKTYR